MILNRLSLCVCLTMFSMTMAFASSEDIENRFLYNDYSKKITMDFKETSLLDVLKIFSQQSGLNFISSADVAGKKVTVFLDNIPTEEALEKILDANDLTYEMTAESNVFVVKKKEAVKTITKVISLKYATVAGSSLNSSSTGKSADSGIGLKAALEAIKSKDGKIEEDTRTNSLIITDVPEQFPLIQETIAKLDVPVLQILIEVEILDVLKEDIDKIGMAFAGNPFSFTAPQNKPWDPYNLFNKTLMPDGTTKAVYPYTVTPATLSLGSVGPNGYAGALDFLKTRINTRSLARPRILTLNNQTAKIEVGGDTVVSVKTTTTSSPTTGTQFTSDPQSKQTGTILNVTPQANGDTGEIIMRVAPEISQTSKSVLQTIDGSGTTIIKNDIYDVEKRKTESIMKAKNGETIILGGLMRTVKTETVDKLPLLGDLPWIGKAFQHKNSDSQERELIIFLTPHILDDNFKKKFDAEAAQRLDREGTDSRKVDVVEQQLNSTEKNYR